MLALMLIFSGLGAGQMIALTAPVCVRGADVGARFPSAQPVTFPSAEFNRPTDGYFIPGEDPRRGVVVVVMPTLNAAAGDRADDMATFVTDGYDVLVFDSRACVGGAAPSLGFLEARQLSDALAWLAARGDADTSRIAVHGFSAGGAAGLIAAAEHPEVAAVIAQGNYARVAAELDAGASRFGLLQLPYLLGAHVAYRLVTGVTLDRLDTAAAVESIAPRPVLLVYGTAEPGMDGARAMAGGRPHVTLVEIDGATHGSYFITAPDFTRDAMLGFLGRVFGERPPA